MGAVIAALVFKTGSETLQLSQENQKLNFWDYRFIDIDGLEIRIGDLCKGCKAVLFVNVATK